jgi:hypothetical protein
MAHVWYPPAETLEYLSAVATSVAPAEVVVDPVPSCP